MESFACYCQKCRAANMPGEELCANCGTPLMLVVTPRSVKHESVWNMYSEEHLLERISLLEMRLMQVTDRLTRILDIMLKQAQTVQREHLLVETLVDALESSNVIENGAVSEIWREKQRAEEKRQASSEQRDRAREETLAHGQNTKIDLFTNLVKEGFRSIENGEDERGLKTLERAAAMSPENFPLLAYIGEHYFRADKRTSARDYLEKAHLIESANFKISLLLGIVLADEGETEKARDLLEQCRGKGKFAANFPLGMIYAREERFGECLQAFRRALSGRAAILFYLLGSVNAELEDNESAQKYLQKAVEADADFADAWYMLGIIRSRLGEDDAAREALSRAATAKDAGAQCRPILKNPQKHAEIANKTLLFAKLAQTKKNLISGSSPRLAKLLREEIEKLIND